MVASVRASTQMHFNFDSVRTRKIEQLIRQLIEDVTNITEMRPLQPGESAEQYVRAVESSINCFLNTGDECVRECPLATIADKEELKGALHEVEITGSAMIDAGRELIKDTSASQRRNKAVQCGRQLLEAVARCLIRCDMIEVRLMIEVVDKTHNLLNNLKGSESNQEVVDRYRAVLAEVSELEETTRRRVGELKDPRERDDLLAARALLKTSTPLVFSATKAYVRHPENRAVEFNLDYSHAEMTRALDAMRSVLQGHPGEFADLGHIGHLIGELEHFQNRVYLEPGTYKDHIHRPELEELLERIVSGSATIADSASTRNDRKQKIVNECNNLRQALQDLLSEYEKNCGRSEHNEEANLAMVIVGRKVKDLRRHLRRAIVDHVSDAFLDTRTPLSILINTAENGDKEQIGAAGEMFMSHAKNMIDVAILVCEMATDNEGIRVIRYTAGQLELLAPQVVNAANLLCDRNESVVAKENMKAFADYWNDKVRLLTLAIDSIITLDDFLAVSEAHIVEDAMTGLTAVHQGNDDMIDRAAGAIRGRSIRVCAAVNDEMETMPQSAYTERVKMATKKLRENLLSQFAESASEVVSRLSALRDRPDERTQEERDRDSDEFINACTLVHEAVKEIRNALLINRNPDDVDSDNEYEDDGQTNVQDGRSQVSDGENQQKLMRRLPEEEKKKIQEQIDVFKITQTKFEREVAKWDETGNDIIVLAKHMCVIMTNMTDFTRGRGPLKTTMDVIRAAQEISVAGSKLNALAKQIGDESVDSSTKNDLFAYLARITLYCQQLNICSRVKADVQQVGNELVVSGLDSAMSLIQTARNLLNAVVLTVKSAYIASTKFRRHNGNLVQVEWKMAPPKKQPLVRPQKNNAVIRRASERRQMPPMRALAEFVQ